MTRPHSPAGHAAAGRWYARRGAQPVTRDTTAPSNAERLARYLSTAGAIARRPLPVLAWDRAREFAESANPFDSLTGEML